MGDVVGNKSPQRHRTRRVFSRFLSVLSVSAVHKLVVIRQRYRERRVFSRFLGVLSVSAVHKLVVFFNNTLSGELPGNGGNL
jgi:hypothetical protein